MTGRLRTSRAGLDLIKSFEGFRDVAVRLPDGRWTIGHGHVRSAREGLTISEKDAEDLLVHDLLPVESAINSLVFTPLDQNQFDALASLVFNISVERFRDSDVLHLLNAGDFLSAASAFDVWRKVRINGRSMVMDALVRRRAVEKAMFLEHPGGRPTAPTPLLPPEADHGIAEGAAAGSQHKAPPGNGQTPDTAEITEAVRRLAERTNGPAAADDNLPTDDAVDDEQIEFEAPRPPPPRSAEEIDEVRRAVATRISKILERTERAIEEEQPTLPGDQIAEPSMPARSVAVASPHMAHVEDNGRERPLIDDTETFDPGEDPAVLFANGERDAEKTNHRARNLGIFNGRFTNIAPWIAILVLSLLGFSIGVVDAIQNTGIAAGASTLLAVFGMLSVMSAYFIVTRAIERDG
ncbi:MAG TPA: lysozyme [Hyphomonadaceae bacterium]|nr:lysozyme [Hyphomonadaceae bacterium]